MVIFIEIGEDLISGRLVFWYCFSVKMFFGMMKLVGSV